MTMPRRWLGRTGLEVSALGLGCGPLGDIRLSDSDAEHLLRTAIDLGVTLFDTAPSYGASEERLGRALRGVRSEIVIVTKGGYGVEGEEDWTARCITRGVDRALERLRTDRIDVFLLHSCPLERLARGDLLESLERARSAGKIRALGYAGDNEALAWAAASSHIDVVECSINLFDQRALARDVGVASARGTGVLAKRSLGNAPWRSIERPERADVAIYWDRMRAMGVTPPTDVDWGEYAIRFAAHAPGVAAALLGTTSIDHLTHATTQIEKGALAAVDRDAITYAFAQRGESWLGIV